MQFLIDGTKAFIQNRYVKNKKKGWLGYVLDEDANGNINVLLIKHPYKGKYKEKLKVISNRRLCDNLDPFDISFKPDHHFI